jgi:hypothetical protein
MTQQPLHPALAPFHQRWSTFLDKVRSRVQEIDAEAKAGYAEVISHDAVDGTGMTGVSSALKARLLQLAQKVDDQWSKIDNELDSVDVEGRTGGYFRGQMVAMTGAFKRWLERETERMIMQGEADWARALHAAALEEIRIPVACQHCGAGLQKPLWHQSINVTCGACRAVSVVTPGTAAAMFVGGTGAIFLAREAAWEQWCAMQDAEALWRRIRTKTLDDLARWEQANRSYWQAYASAMGSYIPSWTAQTVQDEVNGKMSQFLLYTAQDDRTVRENNTVGVNAVAAGDPNQLVAWIQRQRDPQNAAEDLINASLERGWNQHAQWVAQILGPMVSSDASWAAEKLDECSYYYATRGD